MIVKFQCLTIFLIGSRVLTSLSLLTVYQIVSERCPSEHPEGKAFSRVRESSTLYGAYPSNDGFIFGFSSLSVDLQALHPSPDQIFQLWQLYLEVVDPLIKLIHTPSVQRDIVGASRHLIDLSPGTEALLFAIYYAAVVSMQGTEHCKQNLGEERPLLLARYDTLTSTHA